MYNPDIKERFIKLCSNNSEDFIRNAERLFSRTEPYEEKKQKDLCKFKKDELIDVLSETISAVRADSSIKPLNIVNSYIKWCESQLIDVQDICIAPEDIDVQNLRNTMVCNPKQMQMYLDALFDKESDNTSACVYRAYLWLAYFGIQNDEDAVKITKDNVNFENMTISCNGKLYEMYKESIPAIRNCAMLKSFNVNGKNYELSRVNNNYLLRMADKNNHKEKDAQDVPGLLTIRTGIIAKRKSALKSNDISVARLAKIKLSYKRAWLSGIFYRTFEAEMAGVEPDFLWIANEKVENYDYKLQSCRKSVKSKVKELSNEYMEDYLRWKKAFSI